MAFKKKLKWRVNMHKQQKKGYIFSGAFFLLFLLLILLLKTMDVRGIGPEGSQIGLAGLNESVFQTLGSSMTWYSITKWLGYIAILTAVFFALLGLLELVQRKSLARVDKDLIVLAGFYVLVMIFYVLFEVIVINYRPILMDGQLEASFPSSHTMLVTCIMGTAILQFHHRIKNELYRSFAEGVSALIIIVTVVGRLLSGVHWFTDILGGVLLSAALISLYYAVSIKPKKATRR